MREGGTNSTSVAKWAYDRVIQTGWEWHRIPVRQAATPVPRRRPEAWRPAPITSPIAWINAAGEEGASSAPAVIQVAGSSFSVQTTAPANVKGWNVYCGTSPATMTIQNPAP